MGFWEKLNQLALCSWLQHSWEYGREWYPWDTWSWIEYEKPICGRCGEVQDGTKWPKYYNST